ncbi:heme-binding protein soul4 isoform 2-T3 [Lycodopsis pacificus]
MALISLEDLDGLDDAQLDDDITDNPEPMDEEDRDRLLTHWQAVASTHHVSVPPDMTGPIQEMTHNNQQREPLPFTPITSHEKMEEVLYEERLYPAGRYLGMTVPVVTNIHMMEDGNTLKKDVQTSYFLPAEFQTDPPRPSDSDITIVYREPIRVIARTFFGSTTEATLTRQIDLLWEILGVGDDLHRDGYMVAAYENPSIPRRRNEIWFIRRNL